MRSDQLPFSSAETSLSRREAEKRNKRERVGLLFLLGYPAGALAEERDQ